MIPKWPLAPVAALVGLARKQAAAPVPRSAQETLPFHSLIPGGVIRVTRDRYAALLQVGDANYSLAPDETQAGMLEAYGRFLNGLDYPIQWLLLNDTLDPAAVVATVPEDKDPRLMQYREWLSEVAATKKAADRRRYLALACTAPEPLAALSDLDRRCAAVEQGLKAVGATVRRLDTDAVMALLYELLNPSLHRVQPWRPPDPGALLRQVSLRDLLAPGAFRFGISDLLIGPDHRRVLFLKDFPNTVTDRLMADLLALEFPVNLSLHLEPEEPARAMRWLAGRINVMSANRLQAQRDGRLPPWDLEHTLSAAETLRDQLLKGETKLFRLAIYLAVTAPDRARLHEHTRAVERLCNRHLVTSAVPAFRQEQGHAATLPMAHDPLGLHRTATTQSAAIFFPFTAPDVWSQLGIFYGLNRVTGSLVIFDRRTDLQNPGGFILGTPGSGKTMAAKVELRRVALTSQDDIFIIDPEHEYGPLVKALGGEVVPISTAAGTRINPLDRYDGNDALGDRLNLKAEFLLGLLDQLIGPLSPEEKSLLDRVTHHAYRRAGLTTPTLRDFHALLLQQEEPTGARLATALELYVTGTLGIFSHPTNVNLSGRLVAFDIKDLGEGLKPLGMQIILDYIWNRICANRGRRRTWVYLDEVYLLFAHPASAQFLYALFKRARKWGAIVTGITQNVEDLLKSPVARAMLANASFKLLFNQAPTDLNLLQEVLHLAPAAASYVSNTLPGQGLMLAEGRAVPLQILVAPDEYRLMSTRPGEMTVDAAD